MLYLNEYYNDCIFENELIDKLKISQQDIDKFKNKFDNIKNKIVKAGVDIKLIEDIIKPHALAAANDIKHGNVKTIGSHFEQIIKEMKETSLIGQIATSIVILVLVIAIGKFLMNILILLEFPPIAVFAIASVFIAPLTEEASKYFSIKYKSTGAYFIVFNFVEFSLYFAKLFSLGVPIFSIIITRSTAVLLHYLLTKIHWQAHKDKKEGQGFIIATTIHALWNLFAVLQNVLQRI